MFLLSFIPGLKTLFSLFCFALMGSSVSAEEPGVQRVKIGFVTTLTSSPAAIGEDMRDAADLALRHLGGKMSGLPVDILYRDDRLNPAIGKQVTDELVQRDDVDFVTGFIWSHVLLASKRSVLKANKFLISANAGPSQLAGKMCHDNFFSISWQGDQTPMALGKLLNDKGIRKVYMMSPNYTAGKDMIAGFERVFKGDIVGRDLTKWGSSIQLDFSAEFAKVKASGAEVLWAFYPGGSNISFLTQYEQSGMSDTIQLYSVFVIDAITLPRMQKAGLRTILGSEFPLFWDPTLDYPANKKFVADFRAQYNRYPSLYAAQSYDAINLINLAVTSVHGDMTDKDGMRSAMETANFPSVRGKFRFGKNHFPIQNFYLRKVISDENGNWTTKVVDTLLTDHQDSYIDKCGRG